MTDAITWTPAMLTTLRDLRAGGAGSKRIGRHAAGSKPSAACRPLLTRPGRADLKLTANDEQVVNAIVCHGVASWKESMSRVLDALALRLAALPRPAVKALVHRLVDALDALWADLESEPAENGGPGKASLQPEWQPESVYKTATRPPRQRAAA